MEWYEKYIVLGVVFLNILGLLFVWHKVESLPIKQGKDALIISNNGDIILKADGFVRIDGDGLIPEKPTEILGDPSRENRWENVYIK